MTKIFSETLFPWRLRKGFSVMKAGPKICVYGQTVVEEDMTDTRLVEACLNLSAACWGEGEGSEGIH